MWCYIERHRPTPQELAQAQWRVEAERRRHEAWWNSVASWQQQQIVWRQELGRHGVGLSAGYHLTEFEFLHLLGQAHQRRAMVGGAAAITAAVIFRDQRH